MGVRVRSWVNGWRSVGTGAGVWRIRAWSVSVHGMLRAGSVRGRGDTHGFLAKNLVKFFDPYIREMPCERHRRPRV